MVEYTNEIVELNGLEFCVLDVSKLDFSNAKVGIKKQVTKVVCANGGEKIETKNCHGKIESITIAQKGDAIFCNNQNDKYIPSSNGVSWKFDNLQNYGYEIVKTKEDCVFVKSTNKALLLVEIIQKNTCIKDAFGKNKHQFLYVGATLKQDIKTGQITGIDKNSFNSTWQVI